MKNNISISVDLNISDSLLKLWNSFSTKRKNQYYYFSIYLFISSAAEIISIGSVIPFLSAITAPERLYNIPLLRVVFNSFGCDKPNEILMPITIFFIIVVLLSGGIRLGGLYIQSRLSTSTAAELGLEIYKKTLNQKYLVHISRNTSDIIAGISKANGIAGNTILPVLTIINSSLMILSILGVLIFFEPLLAISTFSFFLFIYAIIYFGTNDKLKKTGEIINTNTNKSIKAVQEGLGGIRDILLDGNQEKYCQQYKKSNFPLLKAHSSVQFVSNSPRYILEALGLIFVSIISYFLSLRSGGLTGVIPMLGALIMSTQRLLPLFQQCYANWAIIKSGHASLNRTLQLLYQESSFSNDYQSSPLEFNSNITFQNISFRYNVNSSFIFENVNLSIPKGSKVGIIGKTGSGKSTFVDLLMGLLSPTDGHITIDDVNLDNDNLPSWQRHISHVPQSIYLADSSIEENIAFSSPNNTIDFPRVVSAAKAAMISNTIENLDKKYQSPVGERGVRMSGGQRQRLGIARALYKGTDVIIFDEATSALDSHTEKDVMREIDAFDESLTIFIIAHRVSTLKNCNIILEIKDGLVLVNNNINQFN